MTTTAFVPDKIDATDLAVLEPLFRALIERAVETEPGLEAWLLDRSELEAACSEAQANLYIATTCNTADEHAQAAYTAFIENVQPALKPLAFDLDKKQADLSKKLGFDTPGTRYHVVTRDTVADVELFRDDNIPLETELAKLDQQYDQVCGRMTVEFEDEERTLPQMARELDATDRPHREKAWRAIADRRLQDKDDIDNIYDRMIELRDKVATNAGYDNFVGYAFDSKHRFDYTPSDCEKFHDAIERRVVPLVRTLDAQRAGDLGLAGNADALRPWDLAVDVKGRSPLRPFEGGKDLVRKTHAALNALDPRLADMFAQLGDGSGRAGSTIDENTPPLDLDSRKGKAPGGYQYMRDRSRVPFIFMNAAGLHRDVETMVHEAGHAFHSMLCIEEPLLHYRHSPIEFAEVASMTMELLTMPHWGTPGSFYEDPADLARAQRAQLEGSIKVLPWIATIDAFQHWVYQNPAHDRAQRRDFWLSLDDRFGHAVSWDGLEDNRANQWQRQGHLFGVPFYYIEYGIAQLGALQLWLRSLEEGPEAAITGYLDALKLGGSRPLPELFEAAGVRFDFSADTVGRLVDRVQAELAKLPE